jgi:hypothetical protein
MLALGLASPAHAAGDTHRYVAQGDDFTVQAFISGWTGVPMRSAMSFVPTSSHASIVISDRLAKGTVPVVLSSANGVRHACASRGSYTTIGDLVPGSRVWVYVLDSAHRGSCTTGGTTGLLTIR